MTHDSAANPPGERSPWQIAARAKIDAPVTPEQLAAVEDTVECWSKGYPRQMYDGYLMGVAIPRMIRDMRALWAERDALAARLALFEADNAGFATFEGNPGMSDIGECEDTLALGDFEPATYKTANRDS